MTDQDDYMRGVVNEDTVPTASDIQFQKTNPLARGDKNVKPLEIYAEHIEIRKQVHGEIRKLYVTLNPALQSVNIIIDRFLNCLSPLKQLHDPGRLPVYTTVPRSTVSDKQSCIWAIVSCLVQAYWEYELRDTDDLAHKIITGAYLEQLKEINEHYPELKIAGAENKGYWLEL